MSSRSSLAGPAAAPPTGSSRSLTRLQRVEQGELFIFLRRFAALLSLLSHHIQVPSLPVLSNFNSAGQGPTTVTLQARQDQVAMQGLWRRLRLRARQDEVSMKGLLGIQRPGPARLIPPPPSQYLPTLPSGPAPRPRTHSKLRLRHQPQLAASGTRTQAAQTVRAGSAATASRLSKYAFAGRPRVRCRQVGCSAAATASFKLR